MQHRVLERVWPGGAPPNTPPALMGQTGLTAIPDFALQPGTSSTIQCPHPIPEFNQSPPILDHFAYRFFRLYSRRIEPDLPPLLSSRIFSFSAGNFPNAPQTLSLISRLENFFPDRKLIDTNTAAIVSTFEQIIRRYFFIAHPK